MFCGTSHTLQSKQMQGYVGTKRLAQRLLQAYHRHLSCIPDIPQPPVYKEYVLPLQVLYAVLRGHRYSQWLSFLHCSTGSDVLPPLMESRFHEPEGWHKVLYAQPWVFFVAYGFLLLPFLLVLQLHSAVPVSYLELLFFHFERQRTVAEHQLDLIFFYHEHCLPFMILPLYRKAVMLTNRSENSIVILTEAKLQDLP